MPTPKVPDWPCNAKIYRIYWDSRPDETGYVGHTRQLLLSTRMAGHKYNARSGHNSLLFDAIRQRSDNFQYELLETIFCQDVDEARSHEKRWLRNVKADLNMYRPIRTPEENIILRNIDRKKWASRPENQEKRKVYAKKNDRRRQVVYRQKNRRDKKYPCYPCSFYGGTHQHLKNHLKTKKHLKDTQ